MTELEQAMGRAGFFRCPNNAARWYAGSFAVKSPARPFELRVTDAIWMVTYPYGKFNESDVVPVLCFGQNVDELTNYLARNGVSYEALPAYSNSWD